MPHPKKRYLGDMINHRLKADLAIQKETAAAKEIEIRAANLHAAEGGEMSTTPAKRTIEHLEKRQKI